jgi:sucrose-6-phosphate hydrolase SacC (GH32 family)
MLHNNSHNIFYSNPLCPAGEKQNHIIPVIEGWYADPEGVIFENKYWIFPTYSAKYKQQVFLDAFSSTDMVTWKKHPKIIDTSIIKWAYMAMWAPSIVKKGQQVFFIFFGK